MPEFPNYITRFIRFICPPHLFEEIEGDLLQRFNRDIERYGRGRAHRRAVYSSIRFLRPGIILRNKFLFESHRLYMLGNYFNIGSRHLLKNKLYSAINVLGLSVGLAAFFLIIQYVNFETSYDTFHENSDEIFRIALEYRENGELTNTSAKNYIEVKEMLRQDLPQLKNLTGFTKIPANTGFLFRYKEKLYNEGGGFIHADSDFFRVFPSLLVKGDVHTALKDKHNLVISESMAKKIFGDSDPIGKQLDDVNENDNRSDYVITGVLRDIPANAHFHVNFIAVVDITEWENLEPWQGFYYTYITLPRSVPVGTVKEQIERISSRLEQAHPNTKGASVILQPIRDIHLHSHLQDELEPNGNERLQYILYAIGVVILGLAWINYANVETARFIKRTKEVGIRRIVGSLKSDLILQFFVEFAILTTIAIAAAVLFLKLIFPHFAFITGVPVAELQWPAQSLWVSSLILFVIGSVVVGIYPVLYLLKHDPVSSIKGHVIRSVRGRTVQKSLLVVQFTSSIALLAFVVVIDQQVKFMRLSDRNLELEKVISLRNPTAYMDEEYDKKKSDYKVFSNKLLLNPAIKAVATSSAIPGVEIGFTYVDLIKRNRDDGFDPTRYKTLFVDYNFITVYGLTLKAGRNYSEQNVQDENWETLILNESAVRALGYGSAEAAINQDVWFMPVEEWHKYRIVGVVEDYHHEAIKKIIYPTIFFLNHNIGQQVYYSISVASQSNPREVVDYIERNWKDTFPEKPFEYFFLDDYYDQQFKSELHFGRVFTLFSTIAIFIACLGILGTTLFETNARLKEISIRKVLGASAASIIGLLSKDNVRSITLSAVLSVPLIFLSATEWLSGYPVRVDLSPLYFFMPVGLILCLVLVTASFQTITAATSNPVDHLKHE